MQTLGSPTPNLIRRGGLDILIEHEVVILSHATKGMVRDDTVRQYVQYTSETVGEYIRHSCYA